ncbi:MAG: hypothetical protein M3Z33_04795 [Actinomycetota bacterium]|nr:hypothetical protein [Actinomycetota bacterium]
MSTWDLLRDLPLEVESHSLEGLEQAFSPEFSRLTTIICLHGGGAEGSGEDVVYEGLDHVAFRDAGHQLGFAGSHTLGSFSELIGALDLFPGAPPVREVSRLYRRWAVESAALDLALAQAGRPLGDVLDRKPAPLTYVVSMRLSPFGHEGPETADRLNALVQRYPNTRFKLDPTNAWTEELVAELAATGAVDSLDLKGHYRGTPVDVDTDPELYRIVAEGFPDAWIEDPDLSVPEADAVLEPHRNRITWDAPIHSIADIEALPFPPRMVNVKPSRFGSLEALCAGYDYCAQHGIDAYGGGQSELGVGRDQIQYLAAIFHPGTPNDTAPKEFNLPSPPDGLPESPLELPIAAAGLRFAQPD